MIGSGGRVRGRAVAFACAASVVSTSSVGSLAQVSVEGGPPTPAPLPRLAVRRAPDAPDCPDGARLAADVARQVGRPVFEPSGSGSLPTVDVAIVRDGPGYQAMVVVEGRARRLADPGPSCAGLSEALAITIAILIDRAAMPVLPAPLPPPEPPPPMPPRPVAIPPSGPRASLALESAFTYGLLGASARPAFTALLEIRVAGPVWLAPGFLWAPSRSIDFPPGAVGVSLAAGTLRACAALLGGARNGPSLSACFEPSFGALHGEGAGYASDDAASRLWATLGLGLVGRGPLFGPVGWFAHAAGFALVGPREQFDVRGVPGIAYDPSPAGLSVGAGLRLTIF